MRRRRRYEVVVEGLYGQAAAQRSVISDHRSESEARENAQLECDRLQVIYGDAAASWRIRVVRDGETVAELVPAGGGPRRRSVAPVASGAPEAGPQAAEPRPPDEPAPAAESRDAAPAVAADGDDPPGRSGDGPVPDWLIARFEESIARQRERTYGPSVRDDDGDDSRP